MNGSKSLSESAAGILKDHNKDPKLIADFKQYVESNAGEVSERKVINLYFQLKLTSRKDPVPINTRGALIEDGTDSEWCGYFENDVIPVLD